MSNPIVLACPTDASSGGRLTPPLWHVDAVRGRPPHQRHPVLNHAKQYAVTLGKVCYEGQMRSILLLLCLALLMSNIGSALAASFDCRRATFPDERAVCANPGLSELDDQASTAFAQAKRVSGDQAVGLGRRFLASRRACGADRVCIGQVYRAMVESYRVLGEGAQVASRTHAPDLPKQVGECAVATVSGVMPRLDPGRKSISQDFDSGTAIEFTNGGYQVSYDREEALLGSRVGDPIRMCLISIPRDCPPNDDRGRVYSTTNLRTGQTWSLPDSQHTCGGA